MKEFPANEEFRSFPRDTPSNYWTSCYVACGLLRPLLTVSHGCTGSLRELRLSTVAADSASRQLKVTSAIRGRHLAPSDRGICAF